MSVRQLTLRIFAGVVAFAIIVGGALLWALNQSDKAGKTADKVRTTATRNTQINRSQRDRISANTRKINRTLQCLSTAKRPQNCIERIAGVRGSGPAGRMGRRGERGLSVVGKRGPKGAQGPQGLPGRDAPPITSERLQEQLRALCGGNCNGTSGKDGEPGKDAPPPTDAQVMAAITAYCAAHDNCRAVAQPGPQGPQGEPGPPAPSIPCSMQDPALAYQCVPPPNAPP